MNYGLERKIQEKVLEIDKLKNTLRFYYPQLGFIPLGGFMVFIYYPNWIFMGFGLIFVFLGFYIVDEIGTRMPKRIRNAEVEYENLVAQAEGEYVKEDDVTIEHSHTWECEYCGKGFASEEEACLHEERCKTHNQ